MRHLTIAKQDTFILKITTAPIIDPSLSNIMMGAGMWTWLTFKEVFVFNSLTAVLIKPCCRSLLFKITKHLQNAVFSTVPCLLKLLAKLVLCSRVQQDSLRKQHSGDVIRFYSTYEKNDDRGCSSDRSEGINVEKLIISFTLLLKRNHIYRRIF